MRKHQRQVAPKYFIKKQIKKTLENSQKNACDVNLTTGFKKWIKFFLKSVFRLMHSRFAESQVEPINASNIFGFITPRKSFLFIADGFPFNGCYKFKQCILKSISATKAVNVRITLILFIDDTREKIILEVFSSA